MTVEGRDTHVDQLVALLKYLSTWKPIELGLQARGVSKLRNGGYLLDAELFISAEVPNHDAVMRAQALLEGQPIEVAERNPVSQGEQLASAFLGGVDHGLGGEEDEGLQSPAL